MSEKVNNKEFSIAALTENYFCCKVTFVNFDKWKEDFFI